MKTLYLSDLDGTLLNRKARVSEYSAGVVARLSARGVCFSYATARSRASALVAAGNLDVRLPVIVYNGAFIQEISSGRRLSGHFFTPEQARRALGCLSEWGTQPLVYAVQGGAERVSWLRGRENEGMLAYMSAREGDPRFRPVDEWARLLEGDLFYFTCIGEARDLSAAHERCAEWPGFRSTLQREIYRPEEFWMEWMPAAATKADAALRLKAMLGCDRIVAFGDAINDIPLFQVADQCYAVANAAPELKAMATGVIASNEEDGVARWLEAHAVEADSEVPRDAD